MKSKVISPKDSYDVGARVRISSRYHWAAGALGTVVIPPLKVQKIAGNFTSVKRVVKAIKGPITFYWVHFDSLQKDSEKSGPYFAAEIDAAFLEPIGDATPQIMPIPDSRIDAVWCENKKLGLKVEFKAFVK